MTARWKIVLSVIALILVSMLVGAYLGSELTRKALRRRGLPQNWNVNAMRSLESRLKLTPAQIPKVQGILDRHVDDLKAIRDDTAKHTLAVLDQLIAEIDAELTPAQRPEFEKIKRIRTENTFEVLNLSPTKKPTP